MTQNQKPIGKKGRELEKNVQNCFTELEMTNEATKWIGS